MSTNIVKSLLNINIKEEIFKLKQKVNKKSIEQILNEELIAGEYGKCLKEFMVCGERVVTLNDYLIVNNKGVFLVNINKKLGIISGKENYEVWKGLNNNRIKKIKNPLEELQDGLKEIKDFLGEKYLTNIYGKIIFSRALEVEDKENCILLKELMEYINGLQSVLTDEEVREIFEELEIINIKDENIRRKRKKLKRNYEVNLIHEKNVVEVVDRIKILNEMRT